jgi:hypothetical protein
MKTPIMLNRIKALRRQGLSGAAIGRRLDVTKQAISYRLRYKPLIEHPAWAGDCNWLFHQYKRKAIQRSYRWALSLKTFTRLIHSPCHYCKADGTNHYGNLRYNGVDRKENTQGYLPANVVPCCGRCNRMKGTLSYSEFLQHVKRISRFLA